MSGTYVSQNGTGEFEIRPFQIEAICQSNSGHSHHYDHWMRINRGAVEITVREPSTYVWISPSGTELTTEEADKLVGQTEYADNGGREQVYGSKGITKREVLGNVIEVIKVAAKDAPTVECKRFNGEIQLFHAFVAKELWHTVKATEPYTQYDCCFLHRDFETGEVVQSYNGNPEATT